ncbi:DUF4349 domain-containing protein [Halorubrum sp. DTA98]|uniref:DUF4349 domain-containing protein n=1 Tax=Halorubrum sp. DTA98 TaxID=3402163 RepID=UPI003AAE56A2
MNTKRVLVVVAVAAMLVLAGCTGADDAGDTAGGDGAIEGDASPDDAADRSTTFEGDDVDADIADGDVDPAALAAEQQLIRTGQLRLTVDEFGESDAAVRAVASERGGFVSEATRETTDRHGEEYTVGTLVLRVPSSEFDAAMADVEAVGDVESASTESEDVSDQLTDIDARLENLRAERDRLRELYDDANETADVLAVQSELSSTQERIERLEARQADLENRVALSTIRVTLSEEPPEPEIEAWHDTGVVAAFLESVSGVGTVLRATVVGTAYALPYVLAFGAPLIGVGVLARRIATTPSLTDDED